MYTSLQEIFTKVATHLLTQKEKAGEFQSRDGIPHPFYCQYRDESGRSCAIGCLIPDSEYKREFEGKSVGEIFLKSHVGPTTASLEPFTEELLQLQAIHDDEEISPSQWKDKLEKFANSYGLVMPRIENE